MFKQNKVNDLRQANREQRQTLNEKDEEIKKLKETVRQLKRQNLEAEVSYYNIIIKLSNLGHSNDIYKNIKMLEIIDNTFKELYEELKYDLFVPNDEEGKIIELNAPEQYA